MPDEALKDLPSEIRNWMGRQLFEHVPNSIAVIDRDFRVVTSNGNFRSVFGDPDGKHCYEVYKSRTTVCEHCLAVGRYLSTKDLMSVGEPGAVKSLTVVSDPFLEDLRGESGPGDIILRNGEGFLVAQDEIGEMVILKRGVEVYTLEKWLQGNQGQKFLIRSPGY